MGNSNGNPLIVKYGMATRFAVGGQNCPLAARRKASPPWSMRRAVRRIANITFDFFDGEGIPCPTRDDLRRALVGKRNCMTVFEMFAVELWGSALSGDVMAMQRLIDMIDGPLVDSRRG